MGTILLNSPPPINKLLFT
ncbi:hypothetical protein ID866_13099 [Astraeus odoratus]|nr:hypothetical protein ID866_13099 [Astraeus odoratus]